MDILKTAVDWTKAEMLSTAVFVLFGVAFLAASYGFWQLGRTEVARAHMVPFAIAGALLLILGLGLFFPSQARVSGFPIAYGSDPSAFIATELARAESVLGQYRIAVFWVFPGIITACALLLLVFDAPLWRAGLVTTIAMMTVLLLVDTNANARLEAFKAALEQAQRHH